MKEITRKIYQFDELDKKVQEKVLDNFHENEQYDFLEDILTEQLKEEFKIHGD